MCKVRSIAILSNQAFSLINFRGLLIKRLVKSGFLVYAFAPDYTNFLREEIKSLGAIPIDGGFSRAGMNPIADVVSMFKLSYLLFSLKISITLAHSIKPVLFGTIAALIGGVSRRLVIIEGLGHIFTDNGARQSWSNLMLRSTVTYLYRFILTLVFKVVFLNTDDLKEFIHLGVVGKKKSIVLGGIGVDLDDWKTAPSISNPITFLLAARLLKDKGVVEFYEAARIIKAIHINTRFILLGSIDVIPSALEKSEVDGWVREGILEWPGNVSVKPWLVQTSVFVLPSYREGVPRSTQEAMALGRPVITTDVPGCRDTVIHGKNGFLVPVRDSFALAEAMLRFINNPELIYSMGMESRAMAIDLFDANNFNLRLLQVINE